ncbi:MAG: hypothetical protein IPJ77_12320 [Planctomycetes bacterium]|nr:hypothetical protein [Planctomycetota bacterium]
MKFLTLLLAAGGVGLFLTLGELRAETGEGRERQTTYFPSGQLWTEAECDAQGGREGLFRRYLSDGRLEAEGRYAAGRMDGEWRWFRADGELDPEKSGLYHEGRRVGELP